MQGFLGRRLSSSNRIWYHNHPLRSIYAPKGAVLGIESTCDESAIAIMDPNTADILGHSVSSQWDSVRQHKGVFPMVAAREQRVNLPTVLSRVLSQIRNETVDLQITKNGDFRVPKLDDIEVIALATGPGLAMCLQEGLIFARKLHLHNPHLKFVAVNHLEAHILVTKLSHPELTFPFLSLLISGGHTIMCLVRNIGEYRVFVQTVDDSIGEAFDKVAVMLDLQLQPDESFGAAVERYARVGVPGVATFPLPFRARSKGSKKDDQFSYSGMKTSVQRFIELKGELTEQDKCDIAYGFQQAAILHLEDRLSIHKHSHLYPKDVRQMVLCGGVASNGVVRDRITRLCSNLKIRCIIPPKHLCTDNGIMIAYAGLVKASLGHYDRISVGHAHQWDLQ